jgi:hypothetical protein
MPEQRSAAKGPPTPCVMDAGAACKVRLGDATCLQESAVWLRSYRSFDDYQKSFFC